MRPKQNDMVLLGILTLTVLAVATSPESSPIRMLAALPLVLFLPGYSLSMALFVATRVSWALRIGLAISLSMSIVVLGGLLFNWLGWELNAGTWILMLGAISYGALFVSWWNRRDAGWSGEAPVPVRQERYRIRSVLMIGIAVLLSLGAYSLAASGAIQHQQSAEVTEFWLLREADNPQILRLGIRNLSTQLERFDVQLKVAERVVAEWNDVGVSTNTTWEASFALNTTAEAGGEVEALLFIHDDPVEFRWVVLNSSSGER